MPAPAVVEGFHILEDRPPGRLPRREGRAVDELVLQAAEEALHRRVIEAIALAAHGRRDPVPGQDRPVGLARVLHPAIGVLDQPAGRLPPLGRDHQGVARGSALPRAARASSPRRWSAMLPPTISRVAMSLTAASYLQPSPVGMEEMA